MIDLYNPIARVLKVVNQLYPDIDMEIDWTNEIDTLGRTYFDESPPLVLISIKCPVEGVVEVIAHEVAHVVAGFDAGHGDEWNAVFKGIHQEFLRNNYD